MKTILSLIYCTLTSSMLMLTHCGFHTYSLGQLPQKLQPLYVETQHPYSTLNKTLEKVLYSLRIPLAQTTTEASTTIHILNEGFNTGVLAESESAKIKQYWLSYHLVYELKNKSNQTIKKPTTILLKRIYTVNEDQVLGTTKENSLLKHTMIRDAVYRLLVQLQSPEILQSIENSK